MNRKSLVSLALAAGVATAMSAPAFAAELENLSGQSCDGAGTWHFVNNQTGGASVGGTITAYFDIGSYTNGASAINRNNQHFYINTTGAATLTGAITNLPGRLVLSDYTCEYEPPKCEKDCEPPPPPCEKDCEPPK
jgi:hypothetical protein